MLRGWFIWCLGERIANPACFRSDAQLELPLHCARGQAAHDLILQDQIEHNDRNACD